MSDGWYLAILIFNEETGTLLNQTALRFWLIMTVNKASSSTYDYIIEKSLSLNLNSGIFNRISVKI